MSHPNTAIIIFIYCNLVVTWWQGLFYMYTKHEIHPIHASDTPAQEKIWLLASLRQEQKLDL